MNRRVQATMLAALMLALSSCSFVFDDGQVSFVDEDAQLHCSQITSVMLAAQSVPSASHIPCIDAMPAGWNLQGTDYESGHVTIRFNSSRAPIDDLTVTFTRECEAPTDLIELDDNIFEGVDHATITAETVSREPLRQRLVVADETGCTEFDLELEADEETTLEDFPTWRWIPRAEINASLGEATDDALRLDP